MARLTEFHRQQLPCPCQRTMRRSPRRYTSRGGIAAREPRPPPRALVLFRRGTRCVAPRCAWLDVVPLAPGVSADWNGAGTWVLKGPQCPSVRVSRLQQRAQLGSGPARPVATDGAQRDW
jgi:hypothetical protein